MLLLFSVLVLVTSVCSSDADRGYNALQFGTSTSDYVPISFDMSPFQYSFSLCTWIKHIYTSSSRPTVFNYWTSSGSSWEILVTANGYRTSVVGDGGLNSFQRKFTAPTGKWYSLCLTWSYSTTTSKLYLDGELVGTDTTSSGRFLYMGGSLRLGMLSYTTSSSYIFGGSVYQLNMFSEVLSAADIKKMAQGGLCADLEQFSDIRVLRWEDILYRSRSGTVTEVDTGCKQILENTRRIQQSLKEASARLNETQLKLQANEDKLEEITTELNRTEDALESTSSRLNSTLKDLESVRNGFNESEDQLANCSRRLESMRNGFNESEDQLASCSRRLNSTQEQLEEVKGELRSTEDELETESAAKNKTEELLGTCSATLTDAQTELAGARKFQNITRWDVLYTAPFFNKIFSDELYEQLTSSWEIMRKFVGANITEGIVDHFRHYHVERGCDNFDLLSPAMLKQFVGVEMTHGIVEHFKQHLQETACNSTTES